MTARKQSNQNTPMKTLTASLIAVTALITFSSCKTVIVEPTKPSVRTTTTEETTIHRPGTTYQRPGATTTETTEVRRY